MSGPLSIDPSGSVKEPEWANKSSGKGPLAKGKKKVEDKVVSSIIAPLESGGPVHKTGAYKLHSGERVLNRSQAKRFKRSQKRSGK